MVKVLTNLGDMVFYNLEDKTYQQFKPYSYNSPQTHMHDMESLKQLGTILIPLEQFDLLKAELEAARAELKTERFLKEQFAKATVNLSQLTNESVES